MIHSIQPYINKSVVVLAQNIPVHMAARAMHEQHVGCVVVSNHSGKMVGLVTDRDLSTQILGFGLPTTTPLEDIMTTDILSVGRTAVISDVVKIMETSGIRRIPVIEKTRNDIEKCIGMVTLDDLISSETVPAESLGRIVRAQIRRRSHRHPKAKPENRSEQTLSHFYSGMAEKMNLTKTQAERVSFYLLKEIVQRVPYTNAVHFISQLPYLIQEDLLNLPAGPNEAITATSIIDGLVQGFDFVRPRAFNILNNFWMGLEELLNPEITNYILSHFPKEIRNLFKDLEIKEENFFPTH